MYIYIYIYKCLHIMHMSLLRSEGSGCSILLNAFPAMLKMIIKLSPIMENQTEKKIENEMETGGIWGFKELKLYAFCNGTWIVGM